MQACREHGRFTIPVDEKGEPAACKNKVHWALLDVAGKVLDLSEVEFNKYTDLA